MVSVNRKVYGIFHPYCNAGGGGERVLWQAAYDILVQDQNCKIVVYTGDTDVTKEEILSNVTKRFDITIDTDRTDFIFLHKRYLVDSKTWPALTLLGQAVGSIILTFEAIRKYQPDVWIDTMGYPFSYPLVSLLLGIPILAYVHFPVISKDMLGKLNVSFSSTYGLKQFIKYLYWSFFMILYTIVGSFVDVVLTNSTWTYNHIRSIWKLNKDISILYPPCSTEKFITPGNLSNSTWNRKNQILVLAQFRPEKRHGLIIEEYSKFLQMLPESPPKLILIGSIRNHQDEQYVQTLISKAVKLRIPDDQIEFILDAKYEVVKEYLSTSSYGLNAMWNEHFGIAVVEYVASGLIPIVHASAGPYLDIVVPWDAKLKAQTATTNDETRTGFFFKDVSDPDYRKQDHTYDSLSETLIKISKLNNSQKVNITARGRECVLEKFSDRKFDSDWNYHIDKISSIHTPKGYRLILVASAIGLIVTLYAFYAAVYR